MRISDWSSDVCSSDLRDLVSAWPVFQPLLTPDGGIHVRQRLVPDQAVNAVSRAEAGRLFAVYVEPPDQVGGDADIERAGAFRGEDVDAGAEFARSEEHTSELQSLMRISYAVFCLKKKTKSHDYTGRPQTTKQ